MVYKSEKVDLTLLVALNPFTSFHSLTSPWDVWECQMYRIQIEESTSLRAKTLSSNITFGLQIGESTSLYTLSKLQIFDLYVSDV